MSPTTTEEFALPERALENFGAAVRAAIEEYGRVTSADVPIEAPRRPEFGDFATSAAFGLAKIVKKSPPEVAAHLVQLLQKSGVLRHELFAAIEPAGGFINVRLAPQCWQNSVARILREGKEFGRCGPSGKRISLEFGSANPTGPLVVVQGRTLSIGQTLANAMQARGHFVFTEWIINDEGAQMETLARSLYARYRQATNPSYPLPEGGYPGEYLIPIARAIRDADGERWESAPESEWLPHFMKFGRDRIVAEQEATAKRFGVHYDHWQSEKELHESGRVKADLERLRERGYTYEQEGALWFKATRFGDDKDRVLVRSDGRTTYYGADVAYHYEKLQRSDYTIDILGPDHHGYIGRIRGVADALGHKDQLDVLISQQITLMRGREQVSMSKRAGNIVTLDEIIDEVGVDAARFFFVMLAPDQPLKFDLELAKEQSNNNPVFYVQYGHARIASVFKNAAASDVDDAARGATLEKLEHPAELALARRLDEFPRVVAATVEQLAPQRLSHYAREVASDFHQFYTHCRILEQDRDTRLARLGLSIAAQQVLASVLGLIGVSAPTSM